MKLQMGHSSRVSEIAFTSDGKYLLSCAKDGKIILWDVQSGREIKTYFGHKYYPVSIDISSDGKFFISGYEYLNLWELKKDKPILSIENPHNKRIVNVKLSKTGKVAYTCAEDKTIKIWDLQDGKEIGLIQTEHKGYLVNIILSSDEKYLVSASSDGEVKIWDLASHALIRTITAHSKTLYKVKISRNNKHIITSSSDQTIKIWDIETGQNVKTINTKDENVFDFDVSPNNENIVYVTKLNSLALYNIESDTKLNILTCKNLVEKSSQITTVSFSPDGKYIAAGFNNNAIRLWRIDQEKEIRTFNGDLTYVSDVDLSTSGKYAAVASYDSTVKVWDLTLAKQIITFKGHSSPVYSACFVPNSNCIISGSVNGSVKLWDFTTGELKRDFIGHNSIVWSLAVTKNGEKAVSGSSDKTVKVWDIKTGKSLFTLTGHTNVVFKVTISDDDEFLASASWDNTIKIWDLKTGSLVKTLIGHQNSVNSISFSPDGKNLVSCSDDFTIKIWDTSSGQVLKTIETDRWMKTVEYFPDGKSFIAAGDNNKIIMYDANTLALLNTYTGHSGRVNSLSIDKSCKFFISGSFDATMRLWNVTNGYWSAFTSSKKRNSDHDFWIVYNKDNFWDSDYTAGSLVCMTQGLEFWNIDQFAVKNNRPDKIVEKLPNVNPDLLLHYKSQYQKRLRRLKLDEKNISLDNNVPISKITNTSQDGQSLTIDFQLKDNICLIKNYNIFINDVSLYGGTGKPISAKEMRINENIKLSVGENKIEISCTNEKGAESYRALTYANYLGETKKDIYFLAFGVSKYQNPNYNLAYADKDAIDLSKVIETYKGKGFENVYTKVLTNEQVTPDAIKASKDFVKNAKPDDTFILFIAGHGMHDKDAEATYYYLTSNADINNLKGTAADFETIEDLLQGIPPRNKLFLMDACESGEIDEEDQGQMIATATGVGIASRGFKTTSSLSTLPAGQAGVNSQQSTKRTYLYQKDRYIYNDLVRRSGAIVFSSSKGGELSYERSDIENGLFTEYIIKALTTTEADKDGDGTVSTDELRTYVSEQVAKASGDLQHPTVDRDNIYQKFGF